LLSFFWGKNGQVFYIENIEGEKIPLHVSLGIIACFYLLPKVQQLFYENWWTNVIK
jgi:hypothetical protein